MFPYIIGFALLSLIAGIVFELFNGRDQKILPVASASFVLALAINWVIVYLMTPSFSHWLAGGYPVLFFFALLIPVVISYIGGYSDYGGTYNGGTVGLTVTILFFVGYLIAVVSTPPTFCNTDQIREQVKLLEITPASSPYPDTDLAQIIRVPSSVALSKAGNVLSGGENVALGNYLQPDLAYRQLIQGVPYSVIDLKVTEWVGFRQAGEVAPGYILVNALDENAQPEIRFGYKFRYVTGGRFELDLDRVVYFDYLLNTPFQIYDLNGMEIDDNFNPSNTGTVMEHAVGFQGMRPAKLLKFDPQTGQREEVALADREEKLPYLDRVYPLEWVKSQVELWGQYYNHNACSWSTLGQEQIDSYADVVTPTGIEYQFTMTGMGDDPSITHLITVDATTGKGTLYPMTGKTIYSIKNKFANLSKEMNPVGYDVEECEIHRIDNSNTVYCILTNTQEGDTTIAGYGFADIEATMSGNDNAYAIAKTFDEAYKKYLLAKSNIVNQTEVTSTVEDIQIHGTVLSNKLVNYGEEAGSYLINVQTDDDESLWFLASGTSLNAAIADPGKAVTITAYQRPNQKFLTVRYLTVDGNPDFGGTLFSDELFEWLRSLLGK